MTEIIYTISNFCFAVKSYLQKYSSEAKPSNQLIYGIGKGVRAAMLSSRFGDKAKLFNSTAYQTIKVFPMEKSDPIDYCGIHWDSCISKSKFRLPKLMDTDTGLPAARLFLIDFSDKVGFLSPEEMIGNNTRKYKFPEGEAFIMNDYLYVNKLTDGVKIMGVFENPEEIDTFNTCYTFDDCGEMVEESCDTPMLEKEFPVPASFRQAIELKTAYNVARFYGVTMQDTKNDARDETEKGGSLPGEDKQ